MSPMKRHGTIALLGVLAGACGSEESRPNPSPGLGELTGAGVEITTDKGSYQDGESVLLTIQNLEPVRLAYHACTRSLDIRVGAGWEPGPESLRLCDKRVYYVDAEATLKDSTNLDIGLAPGEYRVVIGFVADDAAEGERIRAVTNSFTVNQ